MIRAEKATIVAQYRLIKVLQDSLQGHVDNLNDLNNPIPTPDKDAYYVYSTQDVVNIILSSKNSGCFIYPLEPSTVTNQRTGDGLVRGEIHETMFQVAFFFKKLAGWNPVEYEGRDLMEVELVYHQANRLAGAALVTLHQEAVDEDSIHEVSVTSLFADTVAFDNDELVGRAVLNVRVIQNVEVDMPRYRI